MIGYAMKPHEQKKINTAVLKLVGVMQELGWEGVDPSMFPAELSQIDALIKQLAQKMADPDNSSEMEEVLPQAIFVPVTNSSEAFLAEQKLLGLGFGYCDGTQLSYESKARPSYGSIIGFDVSRNGVISFSVKGDEHKFFKEDERRLVPHPLLVDVGPENIGEFFK